MSRKCELTGKSPLKGHTVSHSNNKVKRKFNPNIKKVSFSSKVLNRKFKLNVSSAGLRTIDYKGGIDKFLRSARAFRLSKKAKKLKIKIISKSE